MTVQRCDDTLVQRCGNGDNEKNDSNSSNENTNLPILFKEVIFTNYVNVH